MSESRFLDGHDSLVVVLLAALYWNVHPAIHNLGVAVSDWNPINLSLSVDARIGAIVLSNAESGVSRYCTKYTTLESVIFNLSDYPKIRIESIRQAKNIWRVAKVWKSSLSNGPNLPTVQHQNPTKPRSSLNQMKRALLNKYPFRCHSGHISLKAKEY